MVSKYAVPYHPMSSSEWKSSVIRGIAVDIMFWSCSSSKQSNLQGEEFATLEKGGSYQSHQENSQVKSCHNENSLLIAGIWNSSSSGGGGNCSRSGSLLLLHLLHLVGTPE